ncbi:hypothetical protein R7Q45_27255, partial [Vibrio sp. 2129(2023)]|uniref:hypothetical protein n=1 Tax=Vibrio sp. 2129(2023) TaxID=3074713 RepID=UPI002963CD94
ISFLSRIVMFSREITTKSIVASKLKLFICLLNEKIPFMVENYSLCLFCGTKSFLHRKLVIYYSLQNAWESMRGVTIVIHVQNNNQNFPPH